jgi:hypothetical protein
MVRDGASRLLTMRVLFEAIQKGNLILRSALLRASRRMRHTTPHSRQHLSEVCQVTPPPKSRGRREDRVRAAPAVSCAICASKNAHTSIQVQRKHSGLPCAMALRLISRSPWCPGFLVTIISVMRKHHRRLDASIGASGPHDFAVRIDVARLATPTRPPQPAPTFVTTADVPSFGTGWRQLRR